MSSAPEIPAAPAGRMPDAAAGKMPAPQEPKLIVEGSDPPLTLGSCILRRPDLAEIVQDALLYFEAQRYNLQAWCIMPNHVHAVLQPLPGYKLKHILHSWKSFTANNINRVLKQSGSLWERESFHHLIRSVEDLERFIYYTQQNPLAAGFVANPNDWKYSNCGAGFQPASIDFIDPRTTPFVNPTTRGELPHLEKEGGTYFVTFRLLDAVILNSKAGKMPAPQDSDCDAGFQPASPNPAGKMPAPQNSDCGAGFQPAAPQE